MDENPRFKDRRQISLLPLSESESEQMFLCV